VVVSTVKVSGELKASGKWEQEKGPEHKQLFWRRLFYNCGRPWNRRGRRVGVFFDRSSRSKEGDKGTMIYKN